MKSFARTYFLVFFFLCLVTWLVWIQLDYPITGIDDANIFFVYAKHFANGDGFVYNIEGERVEGFSSLLWTLVCALAFHLSSNPELILITVNVILTALGATVALSYLQSTHSNQEGGPYTKLVSSLVFLVLLFTSPTYITWNTLTLMENAMWGLLLLLATIFVTKDNISSKTINAIFTPLAIALLLTRPESLLWIAVFTVILFVRRAQALGTLPAIREMVPLFATIVITIILLTAFRLFYFGYPLPNTYYAKVSPSLAYNFSTGLRYFAQYFMSSPIVWLCVLAVILATVHTIVMFVGGKFTGEGVVFLPVIAGIGLLVPLITGGDHFPSFRFYQAIYPILLLCLSYYIRSVLPQYIRLGFIPLIPRLSQRIFVSTLVSIFVASFVIYQLFTWTHVDDTLKMSHDFELAKEGRETGQFIQEMFDTLPHLPRIGVVAAGGIKYAYPGEVVDLMGLNNQLMAHNGGNRFGIKNHAAFEKATFYLLLPDIVQAQIVSNMDWQQNGISLIEEPWLFTESGPFKGLYNDPAFLELYVYAKVDQKVLEADRGLIGWFRNDFVNELDASGYFLIERYDVSDLQASKLDQE